MHCEVDADSFFADLASREEEKVEVLERARLFFRSFQGYEPHSATVILRELLNNAIHHGNKGNAAKRVHVSIRQLAQGFLLIVEDEGEGFDYSALPLEVPQEPHHLKQRGLVLVRILSKQVEFNRRGSQVVVLI